MSRLKGIKNKPKVYTEPMDAPVKGKKVTITLKCTGRKYQSEGDTFEDALSKIKISGGAKALSVLTVEKDGIKREKILNGMHTNGLFGQGSPTMREIHLKQIKLILGV